VHSQERDVERAPKEPVNVLRHYVLWSLGRAPAETQTSEAECECLSRHVNGRHRIVEIGVWHGVTTLVLRRAMTAGGVLFAVDPFPVGRLGISLQQAIAHREVGRVSNGSVVWLRLTGAEAAAAFARNGEPPVDFVFIDGDHSREAAEADWRGWSGLVVPAGIVALHDSHPTPERPLTDAGSRIFTETVILRDPRFEVIDVVDSLTVLRRRAA
jgi:predicted O-methyltransferase YrrM